jgi:hypothetical protein
LIFYNDDINIEDKTGKTGNSAYSFAKKLNFFQIVKLFGIFKFNNSDDEIYLKKIIFKLLLFQDFDINIIFD